MNIRKPSANAVLSLASLAMIIWILASTQPLGWAFAGWVVALDIFNVVFWLLFPEILMTNPEENVSEAPKQTSLAE